MLYIAKKGEYRKDVKDVTLGEILGLHTMHLSPAFSWLNCEFVTVIATLYRPTLIDLRPATMPTALSSSR